MENSSRGGPGTNQHQTKPRQATSAEVLASDRVTVDAFADDPFGVDDTVQVQLDSEARNLWDSDPADDPHNVRRDMALGRVHQASETLNADADQAALATERLHDAAEATSEQRRPRWAGGTEHDPRPFFRRDPQPDRLVVYAPQLGLDTEEADEQLTQLETELHGVAADGSVPLERRRRQLSTGLLGYRSALTAKMAGRPSGTHAAAARLRGFKDELFGSL